MGYLVCEKCGGYYQLQEGESSTDFEECHCGGSLKYLDTREELNQNTDYTPENKIIPSTIILRLSGIFIGALIMYLPYYIFSPDPRSPAFVLNNFYTSLAIWALGGLVAASIAGGSINEGLKNGFYAAFLSGLMVIILFYWVFNNQFTGPSTADNLAFFAALSTVYILFPGIFGATGGLLGVLLRKGLNY